MGNRRSWARPAARRGRMPLLEADRFLIVNGDTLADVDLHGAGGAARRHQRAGHDGGRRRAILGYNAHRRRRRRHRPRASSEPHLHRHRWHPGTFHFIGVQVVERGGVRRRRARTRRRKPCTASIPALIARRPGSVRVFRTGAEFFDIGTPRDYLETAIDDRRARRHAARSRPRLHDRRRRAARRHHPLGRVTVGAGASLTDCVVADGVTVPRRR